MKGNLVLLVLSAMLLAQQCAARSVPRSVQYSDRGELFTQMKADYKDFVKGTLRDGKNYLERSHAEIADMAEPTQDMRRLSSKITKLLSDINDVLGKPEIDDAVNFFEMIVCFAQSMMFPLEFVMDEDAMELLDRNGLSEFFDGFQRDADTFLDKFDAVIKTYLDNLSEAKKIKEHDMVEWYNEFKKVPADTNSRFQKASQFFQKFKPGASLFKQLT